MASLTKYESFEFLNGGIKSVVKAVRLLSHFYFYNGDYVAPLIVLNNKSALYQG